MMEKRPMVCVTDVDGKIYPLGGNMRLKALQELKHKDIPDNWVQMADDWTEEQRREFIIKDNIGFGQWDWEELANEWDTEQLEEWGLDVWTPEEIDLDEFFNESEDDGSGKKSKIVLEYSADEYEKVVAAFDKIDGSKEQIVWRLLNLDDEE